MADGAFTYRHYSDAALRLMLDGEDEDTKLLNEPLPEEDIEVPHALVPPLQEEEDESVLPSASHPSYPYGNPYTLSLLPLRPSARSTKKGLKGNPHTRHIHTWTDLALEDLLPWEGDEPDLNYFAGLEAEAAAAAHAAASAAAGQGDTSQAQQGDMEVEASQQDQQQQQGEGTDGQQEQEGEQGSGDESDAQTDASE